MDWCAVFYGTIGSGIYQISLLHSQRHPALIGIARGVLPVQKSRGLRLAALHLALFGIAPV